MVIKTATAIKAIASAVFLNMNILLPHPGMHPAARVLEGWAARARMDSYQPWAIFAGGLLRRPTRTMEFVPRDTAQIGFQQPILPCAQRIQHLLLYRDKPRLSARAVSKIG